MTRRTFARNTIGALFGVSAIPTFGQKPPSPITNHPTHHRIWYVVIYCDETTARIELGRFINSGWQVRENAQWKYPLNGIECSEEFKRLNFKADRLNEIKRIRKEGISRIRNINWKFMEDAFELGTNSME